MTLDAEISIVGGPERVAELLGEPSPTAEHRHQSPHAFHRRAQVVLVMASHPDVTSLLCGFVSLSGHSAAAPLDDEPIEQAVLRIRPRVAVIDFDHPGAASGRIAHQLHRIGTRIVLCSTWERSPEALHRARALEALFFSLPISHHDFDLLLRTALMV
jgi:hypothetical protein